MPRNMRRLNLPHADTSIAQTCGQYTSTDISCIGNRTHKNLRHGSKITGLFSSKKERCGTMATYRIQRKKEGEELISYSISLPLRYGAWDLWISSGVLFLSEPRSGWVGRWWREGKWLPVDVASHVERERERERLRISRTENLYIVYRGRTRKKVHVRDLPTLIVYRSCMQCPCTFPSPTSMLFSSGNFFIWTLWDGGIDW